MGVYHSYNYVNFKTYLTFDENGDEQWTDPVPYLNEYRSIESTYQMCEIGMFRSPDGKRIVGLARSQSHNNPATLIYSDDEGETWSEPMDLPGSLAGERHKASYDPISGRLVITFREIKYDLNGNNQFDGYNDWICGDWVAWVGTYEDLMEQNDGEYHILLAEDWANNAKSGDTGYAGVVVLEDGTFIMNSYGHWDKDFSLSWPNGVTTDLCYIKQAKFKLGEIENASNLVNRDALNEFIIKVENTDSNLYTKESFAKFKAALDKAISINSDSISQQVQVDDALETLVVAYNNLQSVDKTTNKTALAIAIEMAEEFNAALENAQTIYANASATQAEVDNAFDRLASVMHMLEFFKGDKTALQKIVDQIANLTASEYIESTWNAMLSVLEKAEGVLGNENAMQEEVDEVYTELVKAFVNLRLKPNKDLLQDLINKANGINRENYTSTSLKAVDDVMVKANEVLNNPEATKEEVEVAVAELTKAMSRLEANPTNPPVNNDVNTVKSVDSIINATKTSDDINIGTFISSGIISLLVLLYSNKKQRIR